MSRNRPADYVIPQRIEKTLALLVEGAAYVATLSKMLDAHTAFAVQIFNFKQEGVTLRQYMKAFVRLKGFSKLEAIGVICDAEESHTGTSQSVRDVFSGLGLPRPEASSSFTHGPPRTGYLIVPDGKKSGCLEHAFLAACKNENLKISAEAFLKSVDDGERNDNWRAKVMVYAMIAGSEKPEATLATSMGLSLWDTNASALCVMRDFAVGLCN